MGSEQPSLGVVGSTTEMKYQPQEDRDSDKIEAIDEIQTDQIVTNFLTDNALTQNNKIDPNCPFSRLGTKALENYPPNFDARKTSNPVIISIPTAKEEEQMSGAPQDIRDHLQNSKTQKLLQNVLACQNSAFLSPKNQS